MGLTYVFGSVPFRTLLHSGKTPQIALRRGASGIPSDDGIRFVFNESELCLILSPHATSALGSAALSLLAPVD